MQVGEVLALFRDLVDERDPTFITSGNAQLYLARGYDQFRQTVIAYDTKPYEVEVTLSLAGVTEYDLATGAVRILGTNVLTHPRLERLVEVWQLTTPLATIPLVPWRGAQSIEELAASTRCQYVFTGTKLYFGSATTGTIRLRYIGASQVDWTVSASEIDDFRAWHDLIALYAALYYEARDGKLNPATTALRNDRLRAFRLFLSRGRDATAAGRVGMVR